MEVRAEFERGMWDALWLVAPADIFLVGLTSIHWRRSLEIWPAGLSLLPARCRARDWRDRYCCGWPRVADTGLRRPGHRRMALLMGTGNDDAESEEPDVLMAVGPHAEEAMGSRKIQIQALRSLALAGHRQSAQPISPRLGCRDHGRRRPKAAKSAAVRATRESAASCSYDHRSVSLRTVVRQRRSAVRWIENSHHPRHVLSDSSKNVGGTRKHSVKHASVDAAHSLGHFVHRVKDLPAGLYLLVRDASQTRALRAAFTKVDQWQRPAECPPQLELYCLIEAEAQQSARQVSCHQDIASDGCFSLGMIAEYEAPIEQNGPWFYPRLFWEAGIIGQVLYLEAEAAGIRSTGIGCYFDDPMHRVLASKTSPTRTSTILRWVGPIEDTRLTTLPAYANE